MTSATKNGLRLGALIGTLLIASGALAKTKTSSADDADNNNAPLFNGWKRSEINQMPQDMFGDTGPVITQSDGISNDPDWINENQ
jgi:hypothetical protein